MNQLSTSSDKNVNTQEKQEYSRKALRQYFREKRNTLTSNQQADAARAVLSQAINHKVFRHCARVAIYLTNEGELNTQPIIDYLWAQNIDVYLPVLHPFSKGYLVFLHYTASTKMKTNIYGILEPALDVTLLCPAAQLDIIITPLVAFDDNGNRMGMGGGFYDRTLKQIATQNIAHEKAVNSADQKQTRLIGLAHDEQKTISLPIQVWDIPLPFILTPTTLYSF